MLIEGSIPSFSTFKEIFLSIEFFNNSRGSIILIFYFFNLIIIIIKIRNKNKKVGKGREV